MSGPFDPYHHWLGIPPEEQPPNHYRLLGIAKFEENPSVIEHAADQRMGYLRTFQTGRHAALSQKLLNEVAAAKVCLLNAERKQAYDQELRPLLAADAGKVSDETPQSHDGAVFGEYLLLDQLGTGGTGQVFKARHRTLGRVVALKMLSPATMQSPERVERFRRKVKILARLNHPNLVTAYDAGERDGTHYLVMQYVDGLDLATLLKQHGPLPVGHAVSYTLQAAAGIGCAHAEGICHRNVKPSNILVDMQGVVKVIGLGLASVAAVPEDAGLGDQLTVTGQVMGTADYMSPEQSVDSSRIDHRADIYSLGCTLCALLTGRSPYPVKSPVKKIIAHRDSPVPSLRELRADVPPALDAAFRKMLAKRPEYRQQSMNEVITALQACEDG